MKVYNKQIPFSVKSASSPPLPIGDHSRILAIGAHPDDIEIGAGGLISYMSRKHKSRIHFAIATYGIKHGHTEENFEKNVRFDEAIRGFSILLNKPKDKARKRLRFGRFEDCNLSCAGHKLIKFLEKNIAKIRPNIILTHAKGDLHDDHRQVNYATLSAARNYHGTILFYQSPSTTPNEFEPNFFLKLDKNDLEAKRRSIEAHSSQRQRFFTSPDHTNNISQAWASFHRLSSDTRLEAFHLYQSFMGL